MSNKWINSAWDCFSPAGDCFTACCCPCIIYAHTAQRLDPAKGNDESKHETCNGDCFVYCIAASCGFGWVMSMMRRTEIRNKFSIEGSAGGDCCMSYCCVCCVEMQNAKECKSRIGPPGVNTQGYAPQPGMHMGYDQQQRGAPMMQQYPQQPQHPQQAQSPQQQALPPQYQQPMPSPQYQQPMPSPQYQQQPQMGYAATPPPPQFHQQSPQLQAK